MEELSYAGASLTPGLLTYRELACLKQLAAEAQAAPPPPAGCAVASVLIAAREASDIDQLCSFLRLLGKAQVPPKLLRVLCHGEQRARRVHERARGVIPGLESRRRGDVVTYWDPGWVLEGSSCLDTVEEGIMEGVALVLGGEGGALGWDVLHRLEAPSLTSDQQLLGGCRTLAASVGRALLDRRGIAVYQHFVVQTGGAFSVFFGGDSSAARVATSWKQLVELLGLPSGSEELGSGVLCSAWLRAA